ncbi:uncharacterized protein LOC106639984 [Copidosoma floridanum]|uniref:uncharacterized protein LOC106639984 n=1 Tax=Copidosoma floridanum TaxID=29053 RepID=UPI000C6FA979|nr:uncharacterized protein LOC106639984 [Copidosoma floridanum]
MKNCINPKNVFYFLRYFGKLIAIWPLKINATKNEVLIHNFKWWVAFTNVIALLIPLNLAVYYFYEDSIKITRSLSEMTALCEIFLNMLASKVMEKKFQNPVLGLLKLFTSNVMEGIRFIILKSNVLMTGAIICGAFQLIQHPPIEILLRFVLMVTAGCFRLYVSAQPASDLRENCESLARSSLYVASQQKSPAAARIAIMLAFRSQKPFVLSIAGLIKSYSVESYAEFLSKTMSYFVSLRAVLEK